MTGTVRYSPPPARLQVKTLKDVIRKPFTPSANLYFLPPDRNPCKLQGDMTRLARVMEAHKLPNKVGWKSYSMEELSNLRLCFAVACSRGLVDAVSSVIDNMNALDKRHPNYMHMIIVGSRNYKASSNDYWPQVLYDGSVGLHIDGRDFRRRVLMHCSAASTEGYLPDQTVTAIEQPFVQKMMVPYFEKDLVRHHKEKQPAFMQDQKTLTPAFNKFLSEINWARVVKKGAEPFALPAGSVSCHVVGEDGAPEGVKAWAHRAPPFTKQSKPRILIQADFF